ncbi:InlB B-repeat-containing protein [Alkalibacter rhizosphaerae]|uniref:InlB B-repeat-containing protein n=1 Tax=Alkalibacter rhizosphaerae TaxID=2815577 RepID=A0A974XIZ6_9FIRM|nr:InlB B-repeat-containing protein [Alkalibacter rhizosphaerae]QSX09258.1 InlB B-repeat-containing protein [Alkalibacter rhizosphaerae]
MKRRVLVLMFALFMVFSFLPLQAMADVLVEDPPALETLPPADEYPPLEEDPPADLEEPAPEGEDPPADYNEPPLEENDPSLIEEPPVQEDPPQDEDLPPDPTEEPEEPVVLMEPLMEPLMAEPEDELELDFVPPDYLDFTLEATDPSYPGESGEGWTWDAATKVLSLNGINMSIITTSELSSTLAAHAFAIQVPNGSTITVTGMNSISHNNGNGILCYGDLTINGSGSLWVDTYYNSIRAIGDLRISQLTMLDLTSSSYNGIRAGAGDYGENDMGSNGDVYLSNVDTVNIDSEESGIRTMSEIFIDGITNLTILSDDASGLRSGPYNVDGYTPGTLGETSITSCGDISINSYENSIRSLGDVLIDNVDSVSLISSDNRGMMVGPGDGDTKDTGALGSVVISNVETFEIESYYDGIKAIGDLTVDNVGTFTIVCDDNSGLRIGPTQNRQTAANGDITITDCGTLDIDAYDNAIRAMGDLYMENVTNIDVTSQNRNGIRVGLGDEEIITASDGNAEILNCGTLSITSDYNGMRITGDLTINGLTALNIQSEWTGLRVGSSYYYDNPERSDYGNSQSDSPGNVILKNVAAMDINAYAKGIHSYGSTLLENCTFAEIVATVAGSEQALKDDEDNVGYGILAGTTIDIVNSHLNVYGDKFGLVTGWVYDAYGYTDINQSPGGDITIDQSYVDANAAPEMMIGYEGPIVFGGYAAIFAGDDKAYEDTGHAQIILIDTVIKTPVDGYIADVVIGQFNCQSFTNEEELMMDSITHWGEALNNVVLEPQYYVTYDGNGGTGSLEDTQDPYLTDATVTVLENTFDLLGYTYDSWNTKADGSGTEYAPGASFVIKGNVTLYAQWNKIPPVVKYVETDPETGLVTEGMKTNVTLPELEDPDTKEVEVYVHVATGSLDDAIRSKVLADLKDKGYELLDILDISLMKKVTEFDGTVTTSTIDNADITGPITVRVLLTGDDVDKDDLAIAYIDDAGNVTVITGTKVTVGDKVYLQFVTDHFSNYALIQELGDQEANPSTGSMDEGSSIGGNEMSLLSFLGIWLLAVGILWIQRRRKAF